MEKFNLHIIDDALPILNLSKKYFQEEYNVSTFENALDCLENIKLGKSKPHIIICDLTMPNMSGDQFVAVLKNDPNFSDIPLMILSAVDDTATRISLYKLGVDDFILKPFNFEELSLRLKIVLKRYQHLMK